MNPIKDEQNRNPLDFSNLAPIMVAPLYPAIPPIGAPDAVRWTLTKIDEQVPSTIRCIIPLCNSPTFAHGNPKRGKQRRKCKKCGKTFTINI